MAGGRGGHPWHRTLNPEQRATCIRIRQEHEPTRSLGSVPGERWSVYMTPTTSEPTYLELRHYLLCGRVARWVVERDGAVSAHNQEGQLSKLVAT